MSHIPLNINKNQQLTWAKYFDAMPVMYEHGPFITEYLHALRAVIDRAMTDYPRVFACRFDLHLPDHHMADGTYSSNAAVSRFVASLKAKIEHNRQSRQGDWVHDTRVRYFWVREIGETGRVHYHFVVLLNADAFNWLGSYASDRDNTSNRIREAWASALNIPVNIAKPLVHFPESPSYQLKRDEPGSIAAFFHRSSYMCKAKTKQYGDGHHGYGCSRG